MSITSEISTPPIPGARHHTQAASIQHLLARSICSGKYLIVVGGDVTSIEAAVLA